MGNIASNSNGEVVLSIKPHCEDCASIVLKAVSAFEGVKSVKADKESNTITVTGDPEKIWERLQKEMKKEVKLISCPSKDKEAPAEVIKVGCLSTDCIVDEFKKIACDTKGLKGWSYDERKLTVKVEGKVNVKALAQTLKERLNKHGQIVLVAAGEEWWWRRQWRAGCYC